MTNNEFEELMSDAEEIFDEDFNTDDDINETEEDTEDTEYQQLEYDDIVESKGNQWRVAQHKMELVAGMFSSKKVSYTCPKCRRQSIYLEPPLIKTAMDTAWSSFFAIRTQRYICFNPSCPMNFIKTRTRFKLGLGGRLVPTHIFHEQTNKNPFLPF